MEYVSIMKFLFTSCVVFYVVLKIVVDFTATWCGPCQFILPAVEEFAKTYIDVEFIKIDVDELVVSKHVNHKKYIHMYKGNINEYVCVYRMWHSSLRWKQCLHSY